MGDKANKLIAWLEKRDKSRTWVSEIRTEEGVQGSTGAELTEVFARYYENIYQ